MDSLNANTSAVATTFAFVPDDLEKAKGRLKEEIFNLKLNFRKWKRKLKNLKMIIFCDCVLFSDKIRNHYKNFPSVKILEVILFFRSSEKL